jgi:hypothetical protein
VKRPLVTVTLVLAAGVPVATAEEARSALFFLFEPTTAKPGDRVTVRTAPTPVTFETRQRVGPLGPPSRLYLLRNDARVKVRSRFDPRLHFIGSIAPDARGRGTLTFTVPPIDSGSYAAAVWCPTCARHSRGRTFSVLGVGAGTVPRFRSRMLLRVITPPSTADSCPVTIPNGNRPLGALRARHGNGLLWTGFPPDGTATVSADRLDPEGSIFWTKLIWIANRVSGDLKVVVRRLDRPAPVLRPDVVSGQLSGWSGPSWAARMRFSSEGCWKVTGRVENVSLSFVIKVVLRRGA